MIFESTKVKAADEAIFYDTKKLGFAFFVE